MRLAVVALLLLALVACCSPLAPCVETRTTVMLLPMHIGKITMLRPQPVSHCVCRVPERCGDTP